MAKVKGKLNKQGISFIFFICMMLLCLCVPVTAVAEEPGAQAEEFSDGSGTEEIKTERGNAVFDDAEFVSESDMPIIAENPDFNIFVAEGETGYDTSDWSDANIVYGSELKKTAKVEIQFLDNTGNPVTSAVYGDIITIQAKVLDEADGTPAVDGTVKFGVGYDVLDTVQVTEGNAVSETIMLEGNAWKPSAYMVQAMYNGGTAFLPNDTASKVLSVNKMDRTIKFSGAPDVSDTEVILPSVLPSAGADDGTISYGYSFTGYSSAVQNWQISPIFSGLEKDKTYYFFAKISAGTYYKETISAPLKTTMEGVWVNNVNLVTDADHTVECGDGTATFDITTRVLTLTNATISNHNTVDDSTGNTVNNHSFIWLNTKKDCKIILQGNNYIGNPGDDSRVAIKSECHLTITGNGNLTVEGWGNNVNKAFIGIESSTKDLSISDTSIVMQNGNIKNQNGSNSFRGITNNGNSKIIISNSTLEIVDYHSGVGGGSESVIIEKDSVLNISVQDAEFEAVYGIVAQDITVNQSVLNYNLSGSDKGISAVDGKDLLVLDGAVVNAVFKGNETRNCVRSTGDMIIRNGSDIKVKSGYPPVYSGGNLSIMDSKVYAESNIRSAIYTEGTLEINGNSNVEAEGYFCGLQSDGDMTISGGMINTISSDDNGIFTSGRVEISGNTEIVTEGY